MSRKEPPEENALPTRKTAVTTQKAAAGSEGTVKKKKRRPAIVGRDIRIALGALLLVGCGVLLYFIALCPLLEAAGEEGGLRNLVVSRLVSAGWLSVQDEEAALADAQGEEGSELTPSYQQVPKTTLNLWYTDEALTDYLTSAALAFSEAYNVRVIPRLSSGLEYLEAINQASVNTEDVPDLYLLGNDSLEKAYLAGLAVEVEDDGWVSGENYAQTAVHAVTYQDRIIGYPLSYETSVLLYNETYLQEMAASYLESLADAAEGEAAQEAVDANGGTPADMDEEGEEEAAEETGTAGTELETAESTDDGLPDEEEVMAAMIPSTIEDILNFADNYDAPDAVEAVFKWDVSDIFYNYFFVGAYVDIGGEDGDDADQVDLYNEDAISCLEAYQELNQFFSIEADEVDYASVVEEFIDGRLVFTVATSDILSELEASMEEAGGFAGEYGVTTLPDIDESLVTRSLSVTQTVVINGYSENKELANALARYLTDEAALELYEKSGKLAARRSASGGMEQAEAFYEEYENSVSIPKLLETSNYWVQMEIAFTKIWSGEEVSQVLSDLSEQMQAQLNGS